MTYKEDKAIMFRESDLEAIDGILYEPKEEELLLRTLFSVKTDIDPGAEKYSYDVIKRSGVAKIIGPQSNDIPLVEADMDRNTVDIYSIATGFKVGIQEMRAAQFAKRSIDATKASIARKAIAQKENSLGWIGDDDYSIEGILKTTGIQTFTVPASGTGDTTPWANKTGLQIIADIRAARAKVNKLPGHSVDTLILPSDYYEMLQNPVSDYDTRPLVQYLTSVGWFTRIEKSDDLVGQGDGGSDCFMVMDTSPEVAELLVPMDITRHEQEYAFPFMKVPIEERTGGMIIRYPQAFCRADGISA